MDTTIASTIIKQLGAYRFQAMTGARDFVALPDGVRFRLPARFAKSAINIIQIKLTAADDYTVTGFTLRGTTCTQKAEQAGVYADNLRAVFTTMTGLETSLGTCGR